LKDNSRDPFRIFVNEHAADRAAVGFLDRDLGIAAVTGAGQAKQKNQDWKA
jgi:hypothetical protein